MNLADELEALRRVIADNDPNEPIADNGMVVWDGVRHTVSYLFPRIIAALRAAEPAQVVDADREAAEKAFDIAFRGDTDGIDDAMASLFTNRAALALAEVVAWLRETDWGDDDDDLYGALAASIEAGDHRKEGA